MRVGRSEAAGQPQSAAVQHSEAARTRNWTTACIGRVRALVVRERAHNTFGDSPRGRSRIVGSGDRASDDEYVSTRERDLLRCSHSRLIVQLTFGESHTRNDRDEVGARRVYARDLLDGAHDTAAA